MKCITQITVFLINKTLKYLEIPYFIHGDLLGETTVDHLLQRLLLALSLSGQFGVSVTEARNVRLQTVKEFFL